MAKKAEKADTTAEDPTEDSPEKTSVSKKEDSSKKEKTAKLTMADIKGLFVSQSSEVKCAAYMYINSTGKIELITGDPVEEERVKLMRVQEFEVVAKFAVPDRKQLEAYRRRSGRWVDEAQSMITDRFHVRSLLLRHHLTDINLPDPETGEKLDLQRSDGRISDEAEAVINDVHPTIVEVLLNKLVFQGDLVF